MGTGNHHSVPKLQYLFIQQNIYQISTVCIAVCLTGMVMIGIMLETDNINPVTCCVTSPSTNQRTVHKLITYPRTPLPHLSFKKAFLKPTWELGCFEYELPGLFLVPYNKHCNFLHHSPVSVDWLYCIPSKGPKFGSLT